MISRCSIPNFVDEISNLEVGFFLMHWEDFNSLYQTYLVSLDRLWRSINLLKCRPGVSGFHCGLQFIEPRGKSLLKERILHIQIRKFTQIFDCTWPTRSFKVCMSVDWMCVNVAELKLNRYTHGSVSRWCSTYTPMSWRDTRRHIK